MVAQDYLSDFGIHNIELVAEEAMLLDWVLTLHSYDEAFLGWLMQPDVQQWRYQAGTIIVKGKGTISLQDDDIKVLLAFIPITFRFDEVDVGFSLKTKLYRSYLNIPEEKEDASKGTAEASTQDNSEPRTESVPPIKD